MISSLFKPSTMSRSLTIMLSVQRTSRHSSPHTEEIILLQLHQQIIGGFYDELSRTV
jgi:hypothetical protein